MPELPEVETIVRTLDKKIKGYEVSSLNVFFPGILRSRREALEKFKGSKIIGLRRRGKLIFFDFDNGFSLLFHLKMTGQFIVCFPDEDQDKHTHFTLKFQDFDKVLRFRDVRKFGYIQCVKTQDLSIHNSLGPEPLEISYSSFKKLFKNRKARLKSLLLNQRFLAGIGNIYADEILFDAKLHPLTSVSFLDEKELKRLWDSIRTLLKKAIRFRGSSIRDFIDAEGKAGTFQDFHKVYGKKSTPCPRCGKRIERLVIGGRSSFFCPQCQEQKEKI